MLVQGVPMRVVMETLGHSQISLTMNTYSHVMPALQKAAADRTYALFWNLIAPGCYMRCYIGHENALPEVFREGVSYLVGPRGFEPPTT